MTITHKTSRSGRDQRSIEPAVGVLAVSSLLRAQLDDRRDKSNTLVAREAACSPFPKECSPWATAVRAIRGWPSVGRSSPESSERLTTSAQVGVPRMARIHPMPVGIRAPRPAGSSRYYCLNACCRGEAQPRTGSTSTSVVRRRPSPTLS